MKAMEEDGGFPRVDGEDGETPLHRHGWTSSDGDL
jgi:hypothetical protein